MNEPTEEMLLAGIAAANRTMPYVNDAQCVAAIWKAMQAARAESPKVPQDDHIMDALVYGTGFMQDGKRVDPKEVYKQALPQGVEDAIHGALTRHGDICRNLTDDLINSVSSALSGMAIVPAGLHPTVIEFAKAMQHKLDKNKHKDGKGWERNPDGSRNGWAGCSVLFLRQKLEEEVMELIDALQHEGAEEIRNEAADVGNIAMMLADVRGALAATKEKIDAPKS